VAFVTGAGGFLGGAVAAAFRLAGWRVAGFDLVGVPGHADLVEGEVTQAALARAAETLGPPQVVFHAAGGASVGASIADAEGDWRRTVGSLLETLAFIEGQTIRPRLIYPSSAAIYGASARPPIAETAPLRPMSPYARHKLEAELMIANLHHELGLDAVIIRFFSLYGPGLRKQILWELAQRIEAGETRIELFGDGSETRDLLYIDDAVQLVGLAAGFDPLPQPLILNGARGEAVTVRAMAEGLVRAMGRDVEVGFNGKVRQGDPASLVADISRAKALGFDPGIELHEGLRRLADWLGLDRRGAY
jgi:UDP-glucose 4-epimerase